MKHSLVGLLLLSLTLIIPAILILLVEQFDLQGLLFLLKRIDALLKLSFVAGIFDIFAKELFLKSFEIVFSLGSAPRFLLKFSG